MKKILLIPVAMVVLLMASCSKKLDVQDPNTPTAANFWKTAADAQAGINAIYSTQHRPGYSRWQFFMTQVRSDEGYSSSPNGDLQNNFDRFLITNYNYYEGTTVWYDSYIGIRRCNEVLQNVPAINMDATTKAQLLAEARFHRAFFYYYLATYWGNVPLITESFKPTDFPTNTPQAQVYEYIETELTAAAPVLPLSYDNANIGRATSGAAYALLGKAYLQQHKYQAAADALKWFTTTGNSIYSLMPNYRDNFVITSENNKESVFELQFALNPTDNHDDDVANGSDNLNYGSSIPPFFGPRPIGFTDGQARRWVVNEMELEKTTTGQRDPRLAASFLFDSTDVRGPNFTLVYGRTFSSLGYSSDSTVVPNTHDVYFRKMQNDFTDNGESFHSGNNYRFCRYADVLLLYAEALNGIGQTSAAYPYVDQVRQRAGLATLSSVMPGLSQAQFLTQLKHERITELSGEGHRWEDLARWGDLGPQLAGRDAGFANFIIGKDELIPIPQQDLDLNPNLHQNPNW